ncbi:transposase (plasmid) [Allorhizobium ampelinum S4]|uniref:Transposase n=1 Tax=Allorhizobium ampelinum (strain ATCC BAA-846 / DSM 112012 / S4) TaxID=311402 RepID=B9K4L4_ALLAM|nr:transposase [Allorhizobium ampelinum S4]
MLGTASAATLAASVDVRCLRLRNDVDLRFKCAIFRVRLSFGRYAGTVIKVRGRWTYLYRAVDKLGNTIDFYLSPTRNAKAAKRFLDKALNDLKDWETPTVINADKAPTYRIALSQLKTKGKYPAEFMHRQVKYLNTVIEADHGKLKQLIRSVRGFKTLKTAYATIKGFEVMRAVRKGQAAIFNLTGDICGEARIDERTFGIGPNALTEASALLAQNRESQAA